MNNHHQTKKMDHLPLSAWKDPRGFASGCLIAIVVVGIIIVGGGIYVSKNYRVWAAKAITLVMTTAINESDLPYDEKNEIAALLDQVKEDYIAGDIELEELGYIAEAMVSCPALAIGMVEQFEASYVIDSALSDKEKADARMHLNRFAQGLINDSINWADLDDVTDPILEYMGGEERTLKPPSQCSLDEIRQVLANVKAAADHQNIAMFFIEIDISDEVERTIENVIGREIL